MNAERLLPVARFWAVLVGSGTIAGLFGAHASACLWGGALAGIACVYVESQDG